MRRSGRLALALAALGLWLPLGAVSAHAEPIEVQATPIRAFHVRDEISRYGDLRFLGGLSLTSRSRAFGALSGLLVSDDGATLLAVSDLGSWLTLDLRQDPDGAPLGIRSADLAPRLGTDGQPISDKPNQDAESLARRGDEVLVSVEVGRALLAYPGADPVSATPRSVSLPAEMRCLPPNGGIEAMDVAPPSSPVAGTLFLFAERGCSRGPVATGPDALPVWRLSPGGASQRMRLVRSDGFRPTGAAFLPRGDLLLLERRYAGGIDIAMRIRRIGRDALAGSAPLDGPVVIEADFAYEIDNMEGIAVSADRAGRPVVTLVSDDNRSLFQRTLVLRFRLETPVPQAKPG
ncbi:esterase-like activity of phytase family protein [Amorphus orientalis]|uniref:Phytase-like domain-containing protein n=1 Tax=Amorphus orientalis TaxID=649198 RepID=A0AAE3VKP6_9HYPH|nr:esterase-like activity of phytase family protein [Amorphus orientalis]MDQ0313816.1 hypothetical protein [Amorphus orientalis]